MSTCKDLSNCCWPDCTCSTRGIKPSLFELIKKASERIMSPEEQYAQMVGFILGQTMAAYPDATEEEVRQTLAALGYTGPQGVQMPDTHQTGTSEPQGGQVTAGNERPSRDTAQEPPLAGSVPVTSGRYSTDECTSNVPKQHG